MRTKTNEGLRPPARPAFADAGAQRQADPGARLSVPCARSRPRLGAGGADRRADLRRRQAAASSARRSEARMDPVLFGWSYDFVGDLAETVALVWPAKPGANREPELSEVVEALRSASRGEVQGLIEGWLDALDADGRWALLKLLTGGLRVGLSARLAKQALADMGGDAPVARDRGGLARPGPALRGPVRLAGGALRAAHRRDARPLPAGDAGAGDRRGGRLRQARPGRLRRRMEVGRHPRAGGQRARRAPALQPHRRGHLGRLPGRGRRR